MLTDEWMSRVQLILTTDLKNTKAKWASSRFKDLLSRWFTGNAPPFPELRQMRPTNKALRRILNIQHSIVFRIAIESETLKYSRQLKF